MATCRTSAENIKIEPVYASWEQQETFKVTTVADVAASLDGKYFTFSSPTVDYYAWMDVATAVDPAPAGKTGIAVTVTSGATAAQVATAIVTAIDAHAAFHAVVDPCDSTSVIVMAKESGSATSAADGLLTNATGFTITTLREGSKLELGALDGDIEIALTEDLLDVTSHQTGTQILTALRTGRNIDNIALTMKESDAAKLKAVIETSGVEYTPAGGTAVSAWGSEDTKAFGNIATACKKLVLHPISKADNVLTEDLCFWRAYPLLTGLSLSGENPRLISVEFKIIPDQLLAKQARQFVFGDHTQNFLAV
jgi:hypothetical protein